MLKPPFSPLYHSSLHEIWSFGVKCSETTYFKPLSSEILERHKQINSALNHGAELVSGPP